MPPNPHTGLLNVTQEEAADALAATEDVTLVRPDGTLTPAGMLYVSDMRTIGHADCEACKPVDPWAVGLKFDTPQVNRSKFARRSRSGRIKP